MCAARNGAFPHPPRGGSAAYDPKGGGIDHGARVFDAPGCLHVPDIVGGVREGEAAALLQSFFAARRPLIARGI